MTLSSFYVQVLSLLITNFFKHKRVVMKDAQMCESDKSGLVHQGYHKVRKSYASEDTPQVFCQKSLLSVVKSQCISFLIRIRHNASRKSLKMVTNNPGLTEHLSVFVLLLFSNGFPRFPRDGKLA